MPLSVGPGDIAWLLLALGLGFASRQVGLPPMNGFLVAGFVLWAIGTSLPAPVTQWSEFGLTLMLFIVGLKLTPRAMVMPKVWASTMVKHEC